MTIKVVAFASTEYQATVELRYQILRKPIGLDFKAEDLALEGSDTHFAAYNDDTLIGCLILTPVSAHVVRMRQVAVALSAQQKGIGHALVQAAEDYALENGFSEIVLSARDSAIPFYLRQNYLLEGEPYIAVGLPHRAMRKKLLDIAARSP